MKKLFNKMFIVLIMLVFACMFFPMPNFQIASAASIDGVAGNRYVLTGLAGTSPEHFFKDDSKNDTFVNAKTTENGGEYYSIVDDGSGTSSGWSELCPTPDMQPFIEKGLLFAKATASIQTEKNTKVTIKISSGDKFKEVSSSGGNVETDLLKIEDFEQNIRFSFETSSPRGENEFVIDVPTIHLYTIIDSVTLDCENQKVAPGQTVKVNAYNEVTKISGSNGNFISFSKINHEIHYEFVSGSEYVNIVGSNFVIKQDAPSGEPITFRVFCNQNSYSTQKIYSTNYVTFTIANPEEIYVDVEVDSDFFDPANFFGTGTYLFGKPITLNVTPKQDFEFLGWYVDGSYVSKNRRLVTSAGKYVFAKFRKNITISGIEVQSRVYDGTVDIDESTASVKFDGLEEGHQLGLEGISLSYRDPNAGEHKLINVSYEELVLTGKNAEIYALKSQNLPNSYGEILKRDAKVVAKDTKKEYGYADSSIEYEADNLVQGEQLSGNLGREAGEKIGKYAITSGNLEEKNPNYNIVIDSSSAQFEITPRKLSLENVTVEEKEYDATREATINAGLRNIFNNEDVKVSLSGEFVSKDAGKGIDVKITQAELYGSDSKNYVLEEYVQPIFGNIDPKPITVKAKECTFTYGEEILLEYDCDLFEGDVLTGSLKIDSKYVGQHLIEQENLSNPNYIISFESAICTIVPRDAFVKAERKSKTFGDKDPSLTFSVSNLVDGDEIFGSLEREQGEDVRSYKILKGTLNNSNYNIVFTENVLEITPREITILVHFLDKEYDGTTNVEHEVEFFNNIKEAEFLLKINALLESKDCGKAKVSVEDYQISCEEMSNYCFKYQYFNSEIEISKRKVNIFVDTSSKTYGDQDPIFTFAANRVVEGESLDLEIARQEGENVGSYAYRLNETYAIKNPNYDINLVESSFEILPREISIFVENQTKYFGDEDPTIKFDIVDKLCFDDKVEEVIDGKIERQAGEAVGVYAYDVEHISTSANYVFKTSGDTNFIILKRPVVVTGKNSTKTYGEDDPVFEYSVENEVEGEKLSVHIIREYGEDVGEYRLLCGTTNDARYAIEFADGAFLTITPCEVSVKADKKVKIYGDEDPSLSVTITKGFLKNNDRLEDIAQGELSREEGENVGTYSIDRGDFSFGKNYVLTFESGSFEIIKRHITITAIESKKTYGDADPEFSFEVSAEGLVFGDKVEGKLSRKEGENVGFYAILQGDIHLSENYSFDFISKNFEIEKKIVEVVPITLSKQYGEEDVEIEYQLVGELVGQDVLEGGLFRDKDKIERESTGKYRIHSTLENPNYEIVFGEHYFTILPREITLKANSVEIVYGDTEPELSYQIVSGTLLDGDLIQGSLQRVKGNSVGAYDIISKLKINRNYNITYIKGEVTIRPLKLTIQSENYEKTYGQSDPSFDFEIVEGNLLEGDKLYGIITREAGEDVGKYNLVNSIYNSNYEITLLPAQLEILKKDVYLISGIYDKIYDGTTRAWLKNPYISGTIDEIYPLYDKNNSAEFESSQVGKNIPVHVHDISLSGEKKDNYNLILPEVLYGDITLGKIEKEDVSVSAKDPVLYDNYVLNYSKESLDGLKKIHNQRLLLKYRIWLENGSHEVSTNSLFTIKINLPKSIYDKNNIYIYKQLEDGTFELLESEKDANGQIIISALSLGEFYIAIDDEAWVDYAVIVSVFVISALCVFALAITVIKMKKRKKILKNY